jgi:hypothetical protein
VQVFGEIAGQVAQSLVLLEFEAGDDERLRSLFFGRPLLRPGLRVGKQQQQARLVGREPMRSMPCWSVVSYCASPKSPSGSFRLADFTRSDGK